MAPSAQRALAPDALFALKVVHDARLSPDGQRVAYVTSRAEEVAAEEVFEITIERLESGARTALAFPGRATFPGWSPDGTRFAFIGSVGGSNRLYVSDANGQGARAVTPEGQDVQGPFTWAPDGSAIAYAVVAQQRPAAVRRFRTRDFRCEGQGFVSHLSVSVHIADLRCAQVRALELGLPITLQPAFSPCGKRLLFIGSDEPIGYSVSYLRGAKLLIADLRSGQMTEIVGGDRWSLSAAAWSPCGERVVFVGARDSRLSVPTVGLWVVNRNGSDARCRTEGFVGNVGLRVHHDMPTWSTQNNIFVVPSAQEAYATVQTHGCAEIWRIALQGEPDCEPVLAGARSCLIMDAQVERSQLLFCETDLRKPWDLCIADLEGQGARRITRFNDEVLAQWPQLEVEHLKFESADGLPLEGWFLSRADRRGPQPTVMFIHGGPYHSTGHAFRFDFHLLAANGYSVLLSNFRGSAGYGEDFAVRIRGDWGNRAFPDHMAAVDCAIARGRADPKRLGVWGHSHGGFATAWIVSHTDRFRAAVAEAGITNFATAYYLSDAPHLFAQELGGRPDQIPEVYRERSPLTYAARCRTPTLMLHGDADLRCPTAEAEQFYRALHDAGCPTELVLMDGMNHMGDSTGPLPARLAQNEALLDWFERYL